MLLPSRNFNPNDILFIQQKNILDEAEKKQRIGRAAEDKMSK